VGAIIYASGVERALPARGGQHAVLRLIAALLDQPRLDRAPLTDVGSLLAAADRTVRRRALLVVISDFITVPGWERPLRRLQRRHDVLTVRLVDPREQELPDVGPIVLDDAETRERLVVDTSDRRLRDRFRAAALERETRIDAALRRAGVDAATIRTDEDLVAALLRIARGRRRRRSTARPGALPIA
jgi:uncharacterized protein (DUF58 family)